MSLRKMCIKLFDEDKPLASLKSDLDSLKKEDASFKADSQKVHREFKRLRPDSQAKYPLTAAESFIVNPRYGLPPTNLIRTLFETDTKKDEIMVEAHRLFGVNNRRELVELTRHRVLPDRGRALLNKLDALSQKKTRY